ncbi:hypothetical protein [Aliivibrio sifiae]|uniref:Uncharacterized protein n=1 Tax=Aliivibrio sifiae TaxID=566293 RepID=A0A2S7X809_9GAMM|nr:hypothetical protein [Aliivibrio sifiae]PQJ87407.1 hypothetical protein BTO23_14920 [Aliivibrio sifiae]GLR77252.1 hypothetical protein GCM10007855_41270 [Aliivibrio sifiae]
MEKFCKSYFEVFSAIELCLDEKLLMPSLSLIYTSIDSLAWITYGDLPVRERYEKWINNYMYRDHHLGATASDLYAARCAILHTLTPDSSLSDNNKARVVMYAWGDSDVNSLKKGIERFSEKEYAALHVDELFSLLKQGVLYLMDDIPDCIYAQERANMHFSSLTTNELKVALGE